MRFELVVAVDLAGGIGKNNKLPWCIPRDLKNFRVLTRATADPTRVNAVLMGNHTFRSIGKPLTGRHNAVLTRNARLLVNPVRALGPRTRLEFTDWPRFPRDVETVFVVGGSSVYKQYVDICSKIHVTLVLGTFDCDRFFQIPRYFTLVESGPHWNPLINCPRIYTCPKSNLCYQHLVYEHTARASQLNPPLTPLPNYATVGCPTLTTWQNIIRTTDMLLRDETNEKQ